MTLNIEIIADEKMTVVKIDEAAFLQLLRERPRVAEAVQDAMYAFKNALDAELGPTTFKVGIPVDEAKRRANERN